MARPSSRISGVVVRGALAPFVDAYRHELKGPWLYGPLRGQPASAGQPLQSLAGGPRSERLRGRRRTDRGLPRLAA